MRVADRLIRWWNGLSSVARSIVSLLLLVPLAELAFWGLVELIGGRQGFGVLAGIAGACTATVMAFSPEDALADPEVGGGFAKDHPTAARVICLMGAVVCLCVAIAAAFGRQLGLFKD